ncbi:hypothetical protein [Calothrix sp. NIES-2100]
MSRKLVRSLSWGLRTQLKLRKTNRQERQGREGRDIVRSSLRLCAFA